MGAAGGGAGSLVEQGLNIAFGNQDNLDDSDIAVSAALGAGMNGVSEVIEQKGKSLIKEMINSDATQKALEKEVKQNAKSTGRKTTPSSVKKAVDDKTKEMTEAADKTLETSLQALGDSFGFYNDVLTDE
jgi:predicted Ser/Thr protein kinase